MKNYFQSGSWNLYCDVCSKKIKASEAKQRWDGFIVCAEDWEPRHPQDFVKAKVDKISVPFARPIEQPIYNITYGVFERLLFTDVVNITANPLKRIDDTLQISDTVVNIYKGKFFSETLAFDESGYLYMYNYTTPVPPDANTYFAEDYVGTLASFT